TELTEENLSALASAPTTCASSPRPVGETAVILTMRDELVETFEKLCRGSSPCRQIFRGRRPARRYLAARPIGDKATRCACRLAESNRAGPKARCRELELRAALPRLLPA